MKVNVSIEVVAAVVIMSVVWIVAPVKMIQNNNETKRAIANQAIMLSALTNSMERQWSLLYTQTIYLLSYQKSVWEICTNVQHLDGMYRDLSNLTVIYTLPHESNEPPGK